MATESSNLKLGSCLHLWNLELDDQILLNMENPIVLDTLKNQLQIRLTLKVQDDEAPWIQLLNDDILVHTTNLFYLEQLKIQIQGKIMAIEIIQNTPELRETLRNDIRHKMLFDRKSHNVSKLN